MTTKITTFEDLIKEAISIESSIRTYWPQNKENEVYTFSYDPAFEHCYESNNGTIAFVHEGKQYVVPYTRAIMSILHGSGFRNKSMYVPFSNWDYPADQKMKWDALRKMQEYQHKLEVMHDCEKESDKQGYGFLSDELLAKCFLIPDTGVAYKHPIHQYEETYYPQIHCLDCVAIDKLGHYTLNNGVCVFIYRNGNTYVTRSWEVKKALFDAGYKEGSLFVPFSNGEVIKDYNLAAQWREICDK